MVTTPLTNVGAGRDIAMPLSTDVFCEAKDANRLASTSTVVTTNAVADDVDNPTIFTDVPLPGNTTEKFVTLLEPLAFTEGFTIEIDTIDGPSTNVVVVEAFETSASHARIMAKSTVDTIVAIVGIAEGGCRCNEG